ncbi:MAG: hypothetical protein WD065_12430 [Planctomycetaceae bacterium]
MHNASPSELGISVLEWLTTELREEINRRQVHRQQPPMMRRMSSFFVAGLTGISMVCLKLLYP